MMSRLEEVWATQQLTNIGAQHDRLETALRQYLGVSELSLFTNGTVALITAIRALGLTGEVLTTPFTFPATPHALSWSGITPVFCDIDPVTLNVDPDAVEHAITSRTSGILAVHVYGNPCDVEALQRVADRHGLKIIYDAAHAFGVRVNGRGIGSFGDATMFSFHATKLFHTAEGGALACRRSGAQSENRRPPQFRHSRSRRGRGDRSQRQDDRAAGGARVVRARGRRRRAGQAPAAAGAIPRAFRRASKASRGFSGLNGADSSCQYRVIRVNEAAFGCSRDALHRDLRGYNVFTGKYFSPALRGIRLLPEPAVRCAGQPAGRDTRGARGAVRAAVRRPHRIGRRSDLRYGRGRP